MVGEWILGGAPRSSDPDAIALFEKALALLEEEPESPERDRRELARYALSAAIPAAAAWSNIAPLSVTSYLLSAPGQIRFNVQPAGGGVVLGGI